MKKIRVLLVFALALAASLPVLAAPPHGGGGYRGGYHGNNHYHGTRWVVGVNVGIPGWGWPYYGYAPWGYPYYPYYSYPYPSPAYYPPAAVAQQPVYVEQQPAPPAQQQSAVGYWYYCANPGAYYPYVKECPAGWQRVAPQPGN